MKVKEESEKVGLILNIQKTKIMASSPITSWQIDGEKMETVTDFIWGTPKSLPTVTAAMKLKDTCSLDKAVILQRRWGTYQKRERLPATMWLPSLLCIFRFSPETIPRCFGVCLSVCLCAHYARYKYSVLFKKVKHANNFPSALIS